MKTVHHTLVTFALFFVASTAHAEIIKVEIVTAIREKPGAIQVGEKTRQILTIDTDKGTVLGEVRTGSTTVAGVELEAVRKRFNQRVEMSAPSAIKISAQGQAASGVGFMPDIDYLLVLSFDVAARTVGIKGSHDGYPSYSILVNGVSAYDFEQGYVAELFGTSDVKVEKAGIPF